MRVRHNQMSRGQYSAVMTSVLMPNLRISVGSYEPAITSQGAPPKGRYGLALPVAGTQGVFVNHHPLRQGEIGLIRPGREFHLHRPPGFRSVAVFPDAALIDRLADAMFGRAFSAIVRDGRAIPTADGMLAVYARRLARICEDAVLGDGPMLSPDAARCGLERVGRELVDALLGIVQPPEPVRGWSARERIVRSAREIIEADAHGELVLSDLCVKLAVPVRTLHDAFQTCLGVTPKQLMLALRLNNVRRCLRHPNAKTTVTDAATMAGFFHFGHFTGQYRRLFGERPSETLRRARC